jgi:hypothetical protein
MSILQLLDDDLLGTSANYRFYRTIIGIFLAAPPVISLLLSEILY